VLFWASYSGDRWLESGSWLLGAGATSGEDRRRGHGASFGALGAIGGFAVPVGCSSGLRRAGSALWAGGLTLIAAAIVVASPRCCRVRRGPRRASVPQGFHVRNRP
jgi:uncharacterized protein involved in response to NO